ncbi:hypothetical protein PTE30175_03756 [Pandoraea terrae]|uniref:PAAR repeat-containing protein n=1 Tax=Pandoraea terrae TaxID=1537710 RepID=A0A5E4XF79_9BURK|nr:PAAR domain-containing protein [Pandoraea terrae]VVE35039.1 hypothetical protein PTE30175_03756 [Pandoraea terrae]
MRRSYLKVGDKSSCDGTVVEGIPFMIHHGTPLTFLGAAVNCPSCKSTGRIGGKGPRLQYDFMGRQPAMEGDICICKCDPPPVMFASQSDMFQIFESNDLAGKGLDSAGEAGAASGAAEASAPVPNVDDWFVIRDASGRAVANTGYTIQRASGETERGTTDASGRTHLLSSETDLDSVTVDLAG